MFGRTKATAADFGINEGSSRGRGGRGRGRSGKSGAFKKFGAARRDADGDSAMGGTKKMSTSTSAGALGKRGKGKKKKGRGPGGQSKDDMDLEIEAAAMRYVGHGASGKKGGKPGKKGGKKDQFKTLSPATLRAIEHNMGLRWNPAEKSLNLSAFLETPAFATVEGFSVPTKWGNAAFCAAIVKLVEAHCTTMTTLDLSGNGIRSMSELRRLATVAPNLMNLNLENNQLKNLGEVGHIKGFQNLVRIRLVGNEAILKHSKDRVAYEKFLRKMFPLLEEIDGDGMSSRLPLALLGSYVPPEPPGIAAIVEAFIVKFFTAMDQPGRPEIADAYTDQSVFSLTLLLFGGIRWPQVYVTSNRNLKDKKIKGEKKIANRMHLGAQIPEILQTFPATAHSAADLVVDVWLATDTVVGVNVSGTFTEAKDALAQGAGIHGTPRVRTFTHMLHQRLAKTKKSLRHPVVANFCRVHVPVQQGSDSLLSALHFPLCPVALHSCYCD
eukprot:m.1008987 g.1008987  ORF g.1008987 m.1008987 type:complete len:496 (+) comp24058_c0_seq65:211-1698(+)